MATTINLDRAIPISIIYPFGVDETITFTYDDEVSLPDTYQIVIYDQAGTLIETIAEGGALTKATNVLTWNINYETGGLLTEGRTYNLEIQNVTQDYRDFAGDITVKPTL